MEKMGCPANQGASALLSLWLRCSRGGRRVAKACSDTSSSSVHSSRWLNSTPVSSVTVSLRSTLCATRTAARSLSLACRYGATVASNSASSASASIAELLSSCCPRLTLPLCMSRCVHERKEGTSTTSLPAPLAAPLPERWKRLSTEGAVEEAVEDEAPLPEGDPLRAFSEPCAAAAAALRVPGSDFLRPPLPGLLLLLLLARLLSAAGSL